MEHVQTKADAPLASHTLRPNPFREAARTIRREVLIRVLQPFFLRTHLPFGQRRQFLGTMDPVRYGAITLAFNRLDEERIAGGIAEAGVYRGDLSRYLHALAPSRKLYLFDTFEGFPGQDLDRADARFRDTSLDLVIMKLGNLDNVEIRKGYFPETAIGLEGERFAFVMLDMDLHKPTAAGLEFFYPRLVRGGYLFLHDFNSDESDSAVRRAVNAFMADKPELPFELPDLYGSVIFRKL